MKSNEPRIRDAENSDMQFVLQMNDAEVRWTSPMDLARLQALAELSEYFRVIECEGQVAGFLLAMRDGCGYVNENIEWFEQRYSDFLYVDRIVIDSRFAGRRLGSLLYGDLFSVARKMGLGSVVCEYAWRPLNEASEKFHRAFGFEEVGQLQVSGTDKVVSMQRCLLV